MDINQIYVNLLFEYKKNKLELYLMPSFTFIEIKYQKIIKKNRNHTYFDNLWNQHIERIQTKIFNNYHIYIAVNVIKKYCNELPFEYQNFNVIYTLCKANEIYKKTILNMDHF